MRFDRRIARYSIELENGEVTDVRRMLGEM